MFMNVAHGLDRVDNDARAVKGNHWIMSSKSSAGSTESIVRIFVEVRQSRGRSVANFAECGWSLKSPSSHDHNLNGSVGAGADHFQLPGGRFQILLGLSPTKHILLYCSCQPASPGLRGGRWLASIGMTPQLSRLDDINSP